MLFHQGLHITAFQASAGVTQCMTCVRPAWQVIVLSEGYQLYFGVPDEAAGWFGSSLGYTYAPAQDGAVSAWLMDLVSVGFSKQSDFGSRCGPTSN